VLDPDALDPDAPEPTYDELLQLYLQDHATRNPDVPAERVQSLFAAMSQDLDTGELPPIEGLSELLDAELPDAPKQQLLA